MDNNPPSTRPDLNVTFVENMRKATRDVHVISDNLVNAKLVFALSDNQVWADGILVFYEIFRYLELAGQRLKGHPINLLLIDGLNRTQAMEDDLNFYLPVDWRKNYTCRASVKKYIDHLIDLENNDPDMLMAYVYHLYLGLLSGGQVMKKKKDMFNRLHKKEQLTAGGSAVLDFGNHTIGGLVLEIKSAMDRIAAGLPEETKERLIKESKVVFLLNNSLVKSIRGTTPVILKKLAVGLLLVPVAGVVYYLLKNRK